MSQIQHIYENVINRAAAKDIYIVGIDGLGGAGKSTISEELCRKFESAHYHTILLHIDDFIHVRKIRYNSACPEWQCYYDLQWRYDYLLDVIGQLKSADDACVEIELYDKDNDTYYKQCFDVKENTIVIVEGIFLQRKELKGLFDYMIYIDIPEDVRLDRVLKRDTYIGGEQEIIDKYHNRYFPAEHIYVEKYAPHKGADFCMNLS